MPFYSQNGASDSSLSLHWWEMRPPQLILSEDRRQTLLGNRSSIPTAHSHIARNNMHFVIGVLKSWPRMMAMHHTNLLPPIIHRVQLEGSMPLPLANCYTLIKMWSGQAEGSSDLANTMLLQEIHRLVIEVSRPSLGTALGLTPESSIHRMMRQICWQLPSHSSCFS